MNHFCTYFDRNYLPAGLALYESLTEHSATFRLWVLCMDSVTYEVLSELNLPDLQLVRLEEFEEGDAQLLEAKRNRSLVEYYFTCTPSLPLYILNRYSEVDAITYLDADLFLFSDPQPLFDELANGSVAIVGHRFPPHLQHMEQAGVYNVSWLTFKRDERALVCLHWWRDRCIEWCYDRFENGRFADQKYLDDWPERFPGVVVLTNKGANLAPWNLANHPLHRNHNHVWVDGQPLVFYHFHGLKQARPWLYRLNLDMYQAKATKIIRYDIYAPYIRSLRDATRMISPALERRGMRAQIFRPRLVPASASTSTRLTFAWRALRDGNYLFSVGGLVL